MCDSVDNRLCSQYGTFRIRRSSHADIIQTSHGRRSLGWGIGPGQRIVAEGAYIGVGNGRGIPSSAERVWGSVISSASSGAPAADTFLHTL